MSTILPAGTWTIEPNHTTVGFVARHLMVTKVRGRFNGVSGSIVVPDDPNGTVVEAVVQMGSVTTGSDDRDAHLRSPDFFDVERFPTMTFRSTGGSFSGSDATMTGDLTIKGVTKPVTFAVEYGGTVSDPWGATRAMFSAEAEINRRDWGLDFQVTLDNGGLLVSEKIKLELEVQAVLAAA
jgi:polyisoprenoid-binding protein YceI